MKVIHSWLKEYVGESLPETKRVEELLTFHAFEVEGIEVVEGEDVIELSVLPDRASDCLSHRGVAHELATILDVELKQDPLQEKIELKQTDKVAINIADAEACPRFTVTFITGIEVKESPEWLQKRLKALGQRPINNIVDATNYVMLALGQPMHAYDADALPLVNGQCQFGVRFAAPGETVSLLAEGGKDEDRVVELTEAELVIVDGSSDTPVGLAGIKGGRFAELSVDTKNIILEAASFNPAVIRKTARRLGILTDASKRFENEPARDLPLYAQQEIVTLITDIAGGTFEGVVDMYPAQSEPILVTVSVDHVNALLGLSLSPQEVVNIIERTGSVVTKNDGGQLTVVPPWERTDLIIEANFIDEVGRIHGLSDIQSVAPEPEPLKEVNVRQYYGDKVRAALIAAGFSEVITSSFLKKGKIQLQNSLASDKSYVRNTLVKNITSVLDANYVHADLLGIPDVRVFEIGTVFFKTDTGVSEYVSLAIGTRTKGNGYNQKDDAALKIGCEAVEEALGTEVGWQIEKGVSEFNFSAVLETLSIPNSYSPLFEQVPSTYKSISPYPAIARDIALWVGVSELSEEVIKTLLEAASSLCVRETLFDTFNKDGRTSYAFRLAFQAKDRTLTDDEINDVMETVYKVAKEKGWEVR
ncbi:MAG: phenylalanyl-tRNA synthetase beta chain [Candidatus Paceibacteria bacterium]|jgi:phenylalanyl-tRNA synthetase beta chain